MQHRYAQHNFTFNDTPPSNVRCDRSSREVNSITRILSKGISVGSLREIGGRMNLQFTQTWVHRLLNPLRRWKKMWHRCEEHNFTSDDPWPSNAHCEHSSSFLYLPDPKRRNARARGAVPMPKKGENKVLSQTFQASLLSPSVAPILRPWIEQLLLEIQRSSILDEEGAGC